MRPTEFTSKLALKKLLLEEGLSLRKSLGQHLLVSRSVLNEILKAAQLTKKDFVVEVGPGLGTLSIPLAQQAGMVLAIEKDPSLVAALKTLSESYPNLEVVAADILALPKSLVAEKVSFWKELKERHPQKGYSRPAYKVVANLPYYITASVLKLFLENEERPNLLVVMVQKEVAEKITAHPGEMSLLSVSVQLFGLPKIVKVVPPEAFFPAPKVASAILLIRTFEKWPWAIDDLKKFFRLVRMAFHAKRKQLINNLREGLGLPREEIEQLLVKRTHVLPRQRAEELSLKEWEELYLVLKKSL